MYQSHHIILYINRNDTDIMQSVNKVYNVITDLKNNPSIVALCILPQYETITQSSIDITPQWLYQYLLKRQLAAINKVIGCSMDFFSDMNEDNSCKINVNISYDFRQNSIVDITLSYNICSQLYSNLDIQMHIRQAFEYLIAVVCPFYAAVVNLQYCKGFLIDKTLNIPNQLHWLNYIKYDYLTLQQYNTNEISMNEFSDGIFLMLNNGPIDVTNKEYISKIENNYLNYFRDITHNIATKRYIHALAQLFDLIIHNRINRAERAVCENAEECCRLEKTYCTPFYF